MLLILPHPDDAAYVSGGLIQIAQKYSIKTKLICLTIGGRRILPKDNKSASKLKDIREKELEKANKFLGLDDLTLWDLEDGNLIKTKSDWLSKLNREIENSKPSLIVTFDHSGITGHPDHLVVSKVVFDLTKKFKNKPNLLLRVPDTQEINYFKDNKAINFAQRPNQKLEYSFGISLNKIKAILAHKSQIKNLLFALQILEWYLFDHQELYHLVDYKKKYPVELSFKYI